MSRVLLASCKIFRILVIFFPYLFQYGQLETAKMFRGFSRILCGLFEDIFFWRVISISGAIYENWMKNVINFKDISLSNHLFLNPYMYHLYRTLSFWCMLHSDQVICRLVSCFKYNYNTIFCEKINIFFSNVKFYIGHAKMKMKSCYIKHLRTIFYKLLKLSKFWRSCFTKMLKI